MTSLHRLGKFEDLSLIATGGQATVYRAHDVETDETVAVKVLTEAPAFSLEHIQRFQLEAETVAGINHPNVVRLLGGDLSGDPKYLAFEFIEGNLKQILGTDGPLDPDRASWIAYQIAQGLGAAHAAGVIHRDVKPSNILLDDGEIVRLIDFGVARGITAQTLTRPGAMVGTVQYMSPEQAEPSVLDDKADLGPQADIYSLGIVLFEMVTGDVPYTGETPVEIALKHINEPVPDVREKKPNVPEWLAHIIERCLQKDPQDRFQTVLALSAALSANLPELIDRHAQLVARKVTERTSTQGWDGSPVSFTGPRRRRWKWVVVGTLVLATIAAVTIGAVLIAVSGDSIADVGGDLNVDVIGVPAPPVELPQVDTEPIQISLIHREGLTTVAIVPDKVGEQLPIRRLEISGNSDLSGASFVIRGIASPVSQGVPELRQSQIIRYLVMDVDGVEDPSDLPSIVEFELATEWLDAEGLTPDKINLFMYVDNDEFREWVRLPTNVIEGTANAVLFSARLAGFSVFAVGSSTALLSSAPPLTPSPPDSSSPIDPRVTGTRTSPTPSPATSVLKDRMLPVIEEAYTGFHLDNTVFPAVRRTDNRKSIEINFNSEMNASTIQNTDFEVVVGGVTHIPIAAAVGESGFRDRVFLTLDFDLATNAVPVIKIVGSISDTAGNITSTGSMVAKDALAPSIEVTLSGGSSVISPTTLTNSAMTILITSDEILSVDPTVEIFNEGETTSAEVRLVVINQGLNVVGGENRFVWIATFRGENFDGTTAAGKAKSVRVTAIDAARTVVQDGATVDGDTIIPTTSAVGRTIKGGADTNADGAILFILDKTAPTLSAWTSFDSLFEGAPLRMFVLNFSEVVTVPKLEIGPFPGLTLEDVTRTLGTLDNKRFVVSAWNFGPGDYTVVASATDAAGNEASNLRENVQLTS